MNIDVKNKLAGILVPVFALRHDDDLGIGDTTAMKKAIDFCQLHKIAVLQVLPINETGGDNSPYNAVSSVALDPVLLSVTPNSVPGLTEKDFSRLAPPELLKELRAASVVYPRVKELKTELLRCAFANFKSGKDNASAQREWQQFEQEHARWLKPYALFRSLMDEHNGNACWPQWAVELSTYEKAQVASSIGSKPDRDDNREFWSFVQWLAFKQWDEVRIYADEKGVQLMGDLPFGVSRYSADVWAEQKLFDLDWSCGAPPETYFQGDLFVQKWGQNWGMPLYRWAEHKREKYAWWRQRVQHVTRFFHYFRIDHVLGFFRVYAFPWIPERNGEFVNLTPKEASLLTKGRLPQFLPRSDEEEEDAEENCADGEAILKVLIDAAGSSGIVAEDLGMVPDYVRPLLQKIGIPGFAIPIFERVEEDRSFKPKETLPPLSLATYGTHDHQPIASFYKYLVEWWHGADGHEGWLEVQRLMTFLEIEDEQPPLTLTENLHFVFLRVLLETPCWLALLMITDLLGTTQRFNEPGMSGDYNWSQRLDRELSLYDQDPQFAPAIKKFSELIEETSRAPKVLSKSKRAV